MKQIKEKRNKEINIINNNLYLVCKLKVLKDFLIKLEDLEILAE